MHLHRRDCNSPAAHRLWACTHLDERAAGAEDHHAARAAAVGRVGDAVLVDHVHAVRAQQAAPERGEQQRQAAAHAVRAAHARRDVARSAAGEDVDVQARAEPTGRRAAVAQAAGGERGGRRRWGASRCEGRVKRLSGTPSLEAEGSPSLPPCPNSLAVPRLLGLGAGADHDRHVGTKRLKERW